MRRFHISERLKGILLPSSNHLTGHVAYSTKVGTIINRINDIVGNDYNKAYSETEKLIKYLDNLIKNNTDKNLGQISDLINYSIN